MPLGRDVRLGLIVVVVADEVLDEVVREELLELAVQLGGEGLVVAEDQRRPLGPFDDVGDGEGLARPGHAQQGLVEGTPESTPSTSWRMASGWSPVGWNSLWSLNVDIAGSQAQKGAAPLLFRLLPVGREILFSDHLKGNLRNDLLVKLHLGGVAAEVTDGVRARGQCSSAPP